MQVLHHLAHACSHLTAIAEKVVATNGRVEPGGYRRGHNDHSLIGRVGGNYAGHAEDSVHFQLKTKRLIKVWLWWRSQRRPR